MPGRASIARGPKCMSTIAPGFAPARTFWTICAGVVEAEPSPEEALQRIRAVAVEGRDVDHVRREGAAAGAHEGLRRGIGADLADERFESSRSLRM